MSLSTLLDLSSASDGLFHVHQVTARGVGRRALCRWKSQGPIREVHPNVFHVLAAPWTPRTAIRAAVLAGGGRAVAGYSSAELLLGLRDAPAGRPEIIIAGKVAPELEGVRVHRTRDLPARDIISIAGIPTTTGPRTLVDLCGGRTRCERIASADDAICAGVVTRPGLHARASDLRSGRAGVGTLVEITATGAEGVFWSALERSFGQQVRRRGLPPPTFNAPVRHRGRLLVVDALWEAQQLVVELHGLRFHDRPADRLRDDERHNLMTEMGVRSLVFGWRQVHEDFDDVARQLSRALGVWV